MNYLQCFFDGSCEPVNPGGTARWGYAVLNDDVIVKTDHGTIGKGEGMTNNVAEYQALIECLRYLTSHHKDDLIEISGDSNMIINMTTGKWGKKKPHKGSPHLKPLLIEARKLFNELDNVDLFWIPREENQLADYLSKLDK